MTHRHILLSILFAAACGSDAPSNPTYFADVQPILRANCVRCHGADPIDPKISKFRLDRYVKDDTTTFDAYDYAVSSGTESAPMIRVAVDHEDPIMPPDYSLTDRQKEILARWADQGAPKGTRGNIAPEIELLAPTDAATADQSLDLTIRAWDLDLDGLIVQLWARDKAGGLDIALGDPTGGGQRTVTVDTGALASKHDFELYAILDDGYEDDPALNRTRFQLFEQIYVDHGLRGTAPTVKLTAPNGGETLIGSVPITWTASDPDVGDTLSINLDLILADGSDTVVASIASGLPNTPSSTSWTIPASVAASNGSGPIPYKIRVTATDTLGMPSNVRSDSSDAPVYIEQATVTTYTWADVEPLFIKYCVKCHGQPARTVALEPFRLDKYDASDPVEPINDDLGVFEMKGNVYQRTVALANMPPAAEPKPTAAERAMIGNWILGGAPRGGGPVNARPTFTWSAPTGPETSGMATLTWSAADPEGLTSGKLEYARANGVPGSNCASILNPTWMPITDPAASAMLMGAMSWMDTFIWNVPTVNGYFCVRGSVTDAAGQTTTVINPYGMK